MELSSQFPFPAMPCGCHATLLYFVHYKKSFSSNQVFSESFTLLPWSSLTFFFFFYFFFPCMYEGLLQLLLSFSAFYKIMRGSNNANGTCRNRRIQCFVGLVPPPLLRRGAARRGGATATAHSAALQVINAREGKMGCHHFWKMFLPAFVHIY